jgi:hypothetical protein
VIRRVSGGLTGGGAPWGNSYRRADLQLESGIR